jgi:hypothetical protein
VNSATLRSDLTSFPILEIERLAELPQIDTESLPGETLA